ncbi:MAG: hypothetical protein KAH30_04415 [Caldisericia bacterium]|nr:hypothetical protein [Caldisericia bacterium]
MNSKMLILVGAIIVVIIFGSLGFISGRQRASLGETIVDTTNLNLSLQGMKIMPNPSEASMLDVRVDIDEDASDLSYISTAYEVFRKVETALGDESKEFEKIRVQICSGYWQRDYVFNVGKSSELESKEISTRNFWVETIENESPDLKMTNTMARPSAFVELADALFQAESIGTKSTATFSISYGKNLRIRIESNDSKNLFDTVASALICTQVSAEKTNMFLDKITVYVKKSGDEEVDFSESLDSLGDSDLINLSGSNELTIKFDYRYLDMVSDGRISVSDFFEHVYISGE